MNFDEFSKKIWKGYFVHKFNSFKNDTEIKALFSLKENAEKLVYEKYLDFNKNTHDEMLNDTRIDRHKIAASITFAIIETQPILISFNKNKKYPIRLFNLNNRIAFNTGLFVIKSFAETIYKIPNFKPVYPMPKQIDKNNEVVKLYEDQMYQLLNHIFNSKKYEVHSLAHIYYWIEQYSLLQ